MTCRRSLARLLMPGVIFLGLVCAVDPARAQQPIAKQQTQPLQASQNEKTQEQTTGTSNDDILVNGNLTAQNTTLSAGGSGNVTQAASGSDISTGTLALSSGTGNVTITNTNATGGLLSIQIDHTVVEGLTLDAQTANTGRRSASSPTTSSSRAVAFSAAASFSRSITRARTPPQRQRRPTTPATS